MQGSSFGKLMACGSDLSLTVPQKWRARATTLPGDPLCTFTRATTDTATAGSSANGEWYNTRRREDGSSLAAQAPSAYRWINAQHMHPPSMYLRSVISS